ncbi:MAG: OmpA family protein [Calothrix sp. C42_A2020_038]|nr:OmpA family protein [Calothrix sp. C42_A2020_038]
MSKYKESPLGIVIALLVTFALSAVGIWWAYQFGFGTGLHGVQQAPDNSTAASPTNPETASTPENVPLEQSATSTLTKTSKPVDNPKLPIQEQVKFVINSSQITAEGQQALDQLLEKSRKHTGKDVIILIKPFVGDSELNRTLGQQRGEQIAGYLRDKGFPNKIIISSLKSNQNENGGDIRQRQYQLVEVTLEKK